MQFQISFTTNEGSIIITLELWASQEKFEENQCIHTFSILFGMKFYLISLSSVIDLTSCLKVSIEELSQ